MGVGAAQKRKCRTDCETQPKKKLTRPPQTLVGLGKAVSVMLRLGSRAGVSAARAGSRRWLSADAAANVVRGDSMPTAEELVEQALAIPSLPMHNTYRKGEHPKSCYPPRHHHRDAMRAAPHRLGCRANALAALGHACRAAAAGMPVRFSSPCCRFSLVHPAPTTPPTTQNRGRRVDPRLSPVRRHGHQVRHDRHVDALGRARSRDGALRA